MTADTDKKKKSMELLSPAGSFDGLIAAIGAGADAVYLGGDRYGARAYAKNFTPTELLRAIDYVHLRGKRLYLTVNTLLKNPEMAELISYLQPFYEEGLDAVLVQDFGVMKRIHEELPLLPIHASTQMAVTGSRGMNFLARYGVTRVVPARELSLEELCRMREESPLEIETFIHGALCYSVSGMCLHSSLIGGRSGNRGRCAQPCRLCYTPVPENGRNKAPEKDGTSPLSMKDLCGIDLIPELAGAGISSLKIEGRMKQPAYTAGVTAVYRKYLDLYEEKGAAGYTVDPEDRRELLAVFSRGGSCEGYYHQHNGKNMIYFSAADKIAAEHETIITECKRKVCGCLRLQAGEPAVFELWPLDDRDMLVRAGGQVVQSAESHPLTVSDLEKRMSKMGDTAFAPEQIRIEVQGNVFLPIGELNSLRREAVRLLEEKLTGPFLRKLPAAATKERGPEPAKGTGAGTAPLCYVSCETASQAEAALRRPYVSGLYLPLSLVDLFFEKCKRASKEICLSLPFMVREDIPANVRKRIEKLAEQGIDGFLVRNLEGYAFLEELGLEKLCILDYHVYTFNEEAVAFWEERGVKRLTVPVELNEKELRHRNNTNSEMLVYGYLPTMISCQCVKKNTAACTAKNDVVSLLDRQSSRFYAQCVCDPWDMTAKPSTQCYNVIYNGLPLGLFQERGRVEQLNVKAVRLSFTLEDGKETERVFQEWEQPKASKDQPQYTKGHFKRGVE